MKKIAIIKTRILVDKRGTLAVDNGISKEGMDLRTEPPV